MFLKLIRCSFLHIYFYLYLSSCVAFYRNAYSVKTFQLSNHVGIRKKVMTSSGTRTAILCHNYYGLKTVWDDEYIRCRTQLKETALMCFIFFFWRKDYLSFHFFKNIFHWLSIEMILPNSVKRNLVTSQKSFMREKTEKLCNTDARHSKRVSWARKNSKMLFYENFKVTHRKFWGLFSN